LVKKESKRLADSLSLCHYQKQLMLEEKKKSPSSFQFKQFSLVQEQSAMKVGTDGVLLGAWAKAADSSSILDIGTGTGLIAIMMAQKAKNAKIDAVEIDKKAFEEAKSNMANAPWADRLSVVQSSIQDYAKLSDSSYDLIVSNPPFFSGGTLSSNNTRNNIRHTTKLPHGDLLAAVRRLLTPEGRFCVILPLIEGLRLREMGERYGLYCSHLTQVKPKADKSVERLLLQFELNKEVETVEDDLIIQHDERNHYTEEYIALTGAFYLNM